MENGERITVNLTKSAAIALSTVAESEGINKTDVVAKSLKAYAYFIEAQNEGATLFFQYEDGTKERVKFL